MGEKNNGPKGGGPPRGPRPYELVRDLVAVGVVVAGGFMSLGRLDQEVDSMNERLDRHENRMVEELEDLESDLEDSLERVYRIRDAEAEVLDSPGSGHVGGSG